jgi:4-azaleucine resistance transporter AzlC
LALSRHFIAGFRAALTISPGVMSWGMISGVAMVAAGLPPVAAMAMSLLVFAGSSQLATLQLMAGGAALPIALLAGFVINLRFVLFSLSLAPHLKHLSRARRAWYSHILSDNGYAMSLSYFDKHASHPDRHLFMHGFGVTLWSSWQISTLIGVVLGAAVPEKWGLGYTIALTFIALVMPQLKYNANIVAAIAAAVTEIFTMSLPFRMGLLISTAVGIAAGMISEKIFHSRSKPVSPDA